MSKTTVICIVPVKNESWVLNDFIKCAQRWADLIIIGDHNSTDQSAQIAQQYDKVKVVPIDNPMFDEGYRRKILWEEARKIPGKRLIISIDADEMISANWAESAEWEQMLTAPPGTRFRFDWLNLMPGINEAGLFDQMAAFVDDGTDFQFHNVKIHTPRIPDSASEIVHLKDIKLLHYVHIDSERMFSKHRYLKCYEFMETAMRPWRVCITYQDTKINNYDAPIIPLQKNWIDGFAWLDEYKSTGGGSRERRYWWDEEILNFFDLYGTKKFRKLNIWDVDWNRKAQMMGRTGNYSDPRSRFEKWIHNYIERHRENLKLRKELKWKIIFRLGILVLRPFGW